MSRIPFAWQAVLGLGLWFFVGLRFFDASEDMFALFLLCCWFSGGIVLFTVGIAREMILQREDERR